MVRLFAELTGDHNPLHMDEDFARRCEYRHTIIHGMLPLLFIALNFKSGDKGVNYGLHKISARFIRPILANSILNIESKVVGIDRQNCRVTFDYGLTKKGSPIVIASGSYVIICGQIPENNDGPKPLSKVNKSMPVQSIKAGGLLFEEINRNDENKFDFMISKYHIRGLFSIIREGMEEKNSFSPAINQNKYPIIENLLATILLSTFVGMCMPGKYATFIDFHLTFLEQIRLFKRYTLKGLVEFKSQPTSTIVESIAIIDSSDNARVCANGKINARVNRPPILMPTIKSMKENAMDLGLKDKVVLVTGASRGIGETTAKLFSLYGCKVAVNYCKRKKDAEKVALEINRNGAKAIAVQADVSDRQQVKKMVALVQKSLGGIDILVNNAVKDFYPKAFMELSWGDFQDEIDVSLKGAFNCLQEVLPLMIKKKEGRIINVATVATDNPPPNQAKYVAAKSALVGLTRSLAVEMGPFDIRVNMVSPSLVETDLTKHIPKVFLDGMKNDTPLKRNAEAIDVAKAIIFLAGNLSGFTTGQKIMVTGGSPPFL